MSFDIENPMDLSTLKAEFVSDPERVGYSAANGATETIRDLLNNAKLNPTNATIDRPIEEIAISEVSELITSGDYEALTLYDKEWVKMLINRSEGACIKDYKKGFLKVFKPGTATLTAAMTLRVKSASRAEELFGVNTIISRLDFIAARES